MNRPTLLVPVVFPDTELHPVSNSLIEEFSGFEIVLFGYWEVPANGDTSEARDAHRLEADAVLFELAAEFSKAGAPTEIQLHFGPPGDQENELRDRIAEQSHADAILIPNPFTTLSHVLVPIRDARHQQQLIAVVGALNEQAVIDVELFHACADQAAVSEAQEMLDRVRDELIQRGFPKLEVETTVVVDDDAAFAITEQARTHGLVIMGETSEPDVEDEIFGPVYESVADRSEHPIVVGREKHT